MPYVARIAMKSAGLRERQRHGLLSRELSRSGRRQPPQGAAVVAREARLDKVRAHETAPLRLQPAAAGLGYQCCAKPLWKPCRRPEGEETTKPADNQAVSITGATGLEPATSGVTGRRSNQLNYAPGRAWPGAAMSMPQHAPRGSQPDSRPRTIAWGWRATAGTTRMAHSLPIEQHGIIGDLHTVALVGTDGTIDWY